MSFFPKGCYGGTWQNCARDNLTATLTTKMQLKHMKWITCIDCLVLIIITCFIVGENKNLLVRTCLITDHFIQGISLEWSVFNSFWTWVIITLIFFIGTNNTAVITINQWAFYLLNRVGGLGQKIDKVAFILALKLFPFSCLFHFQN